MVAPGGISRTQQSARTASDVFRVVLVEIDKPIWTVAADEVVVPARYLRTAPTGRRVALVTITVDDIGAVTTLNDVISGPAMKNVRAIARCVEQPFVIAEYEVIACAAVYDVLAVTADEFVIASTTDNDVLAVASGQDLIAIIQLFPGRDATAF